MCWVRKPVCYLRGLSENSILAAQVFHELLGFNVADPTVRVGAASAAVDAARFGDGEVRVTLAAHAPYSVSPAMFRAIRVAVDERPAPVTSVHLGESPDEVEFLKQGTGSVRALLEELGVWAANWEPPGTSPVTYLSDLGFLDRCALVVHGVQFDGDDLSRLAALGVTLAACPRSNVHVGVGSPPLEAFYAMDVNVAFGTDSLASVSDLNVFAELKEARRIAPRSAPSAHSPAVHRDGRDWEGSRCRGRRGETQRRRPRPCPTRTPGSRPGDRWTDRAP